MGAGPTRRNGGLRSRGRDTAGRLLGSPRILSGSRTAALPNTGTSYKTRRQKRNRRAACQCLAITSLADVPATAYQRRDCGPVGLGRLHEACDDDRRGRSHCGANRVPDRRKVFLVPSPEFHAGMIFPEQALWQDRQTFPSPRFLLKKFCQRLTRLLWPFLEDPMTSVL